MALQEKLRESREYLISFKKKYELKTQFSLKQKDKEIAKVVKWVMELENLWKEWKLAKENEVHNWTS